MGSEQLHLGYELDDERAVYISSFNDFLKEIRPILDVLTFVSWVLSFFLVVSYIGCHINDNSKNVGILRTLGISRKNTAKIILYESIFISFLSILIANILASAGLRQANKYLYVTAENMQISFISINRGIWFVVDIVLLILVVSCTYIPIYNMSKKKPIVLLDG